MRVNWNRVQSLLLYLAIIIGYIVLFWYGFMDKAVVVEATAPSPTPQVITKTVVQPLIIEVPVPIPGEVSAELLGEFTVTYYTAGPESTGKSPGHPAYGITKSGATVWEGVTCAVDPRVIPLGSYLYIEGIGFRVAQDTGGGIKGNKVDIYVPTVKEALNKGRHTAAVYIIRGGN